jgi:hypothetical protein
LSGRIEIGSKLRNGRAVIDRFEIGHEPIALLTRQAELEKDVGYLVISQRPGPALLHVDQLPVGGILDDEQADIVERTRASFDALIRERKYGEVTTEVGPAEGLPFYFAEPYHQQYLYSHPNGYDCHSETGLKLPAL